MKDSFSKFQIIGQHSKIRKDEQGLIHKRYNQRNKIQEKEVKVVECILEDWKTNNKQHPNIVGYKQVNFTEDGHEIIMESCDGSLLNLLNEYNKTGQFFDIPILIDFLQQIMRGYKYLQRLFPQFIHRDFTLDNFLYTKSDEKFTIKISDFGVSKIIKKEKDQKQSDLKNQKAILSKDFQNQKKIFMPKEILERTEYDNRVDVYSLGTCLYFLKQGMIDEKYAGYQSNSDNPIFRESEIKNKFIKLVSQMCRVEACDRPKFEELYQYLYDLPQLYNPLNKKNYLANDLDFLKYFETAIFQICPPQINNKIIYIQKKFDKMKDEITIIKIDQKVLSLVNKFMPLFFNQQLDKKSFFTILIIFLDKIKRAHQKLLDHSVYSDQVFFFRIQSLQHVRNIVSHTQNKMMYNAQKQPYGDCLLQGYTDLIQDYKAQLRVLKSILSMTNNTNKKYFFKYQQKIKEEMG